MSEKMIQTLKQARLVSVPLVSIRTSDQAATTALIATMAPKHPVVQWDAANGMRAINDEGKKAIAALSKNTDLSTVGFVEAMIESDKLPQKSILVAHNAHRQMLSMEPAATATAVQAVANLRNAFKKDHRMLVMLSPGFALPGELEQDVVTMTHELPGHAELRTLLKELVAGIADEKFEAPTEDEMARAVRAVSGLSEFAAEQAAAMSVKATGLDLDTLWERKRIQVEQCPGLKVHRGRETFADIVGLDNVKARLRQRAKGKKPVGVVLILDEVDKVMANVENDTTGVRMDQLRTLLTEMEDNEWEGMLLAGLPGAGKSLIAKAFGNELGVPTVMLDLGAMEGSLVGQSEERIRHAMDVIKAIGDGHCYVVATSNNASVMRPELQRRMTGGFFFVDQMSDEQKVAAWSYYIARYGLDARQRVPNDASWSAAEIRNCAREAANCEVTLVEAARFIVPVAQARSEEFEAMRRYAHGKYLDADVVGQTYGYRAEVTQQARRAITLPVDLDALASMKES